MLILKICTVRRYWDLDRKSIFCKKKKKKMHEVRKSDII